MTDNFNPTEWTTTKEAAELMGYHNWEFYSRKDLPNNMLGGSLRCNITRWVFVEKEK